MRDRPYRLWNITDDPSRNTVQDLRSDAEVISELARSYRERVTRMSSKTDVERQSMTQIRDLIRDAQRVFEEIEHLLDITMETWR